MKVISSNKIGSLLILSACLTSMTLFSSSVSAAPKEKELKCTQLKGINQQILANERVLTQLEKSYEKIQAQLDAKKVRIDEKLLLLNKSSEELALRCSAEVTPTPVATPPVDPTVAVE